MPHKKCLFLALRPELDGIRKSIHCLPVASDKRASKVYVLQVMLFALEIGNLTYVVAGCYQQTIRT